MRNIIFAAAALLAVAAPGIAAADTGGSVTATYASIDSDIGSKNNVVALSGVVVTDLASDWRLQFNGASADTDQFNNSYAYSQAEAHVVYSSGMWEFGGFTGISNTNGWGWWEYGVEAAVNFDRARIEVSAAGAASPNSNYNNISTYAARGSYSFTDNLSVGATVSTTDFSNYSSTGDNVNSWGVHVAYMIPNTHVTVAAGYRSSDDGHNHNAHFWGVSLAWNFGGGTKGREMLGANALIPDAITDE